MSTKRPDPPEGARNLVVLVLDSLRYDSWLQADTRGFSRLGEVERRWSYASWTAPSHYNFLMGLLPHTSPQRVYASEYYKQDYVRYSERLGVEGIEFRNLLPSIFLSTYLRNTLGYKVRAKVSMPVLNPHTAINKDFDSYELMPAHNDLSAMVETLEFHPERPTFYLLNTGETHYPYALPDEDPNEWPRISGAHGVLKTLDTAISGARADEPETFFDEEKLATLRSRQIRACSHVSDVFDRLLDVTPPKTWIVVTSDHGDLFGEDGYFGHGPVCHPKVFEVPFIEGPRP